MSELDPSPVLADEANPTTALVLAEEKPATTTIELEKRKIILHQWEQRRDLHHPSTKSYRALDERCAVLRQKVETDCDEYRAKQLLRPKTRAAASAKRKQTLKAKREAMVSDVVKRVTDALGTDAAGKKRAAAAVADLFGENVAPEPAKKKVKVVKKRSEIEEEDD